MSEKLTPWFPGDVKPVMVGIYQQESLGDIGFQYWNGKAWSMWQLDAISAFYLRHVLASDKHQKDKWRGLAEPPK